MKGDQVLCDGLGGRKLHSRSRLPVVQIAPGQRRDQGKKRGRCRPHTGYASQFGGVGLQHGRERAESLQETMSQGIGVHARHRVEQQQFEDLVVGERIKPFLGRTLPQPVAVARMRFLVHLAHAHPALHDLILWGEASDGGSMPPTGAGAKARGLSGSCSGLCDPRAFARGSSSWFERPTCSRTAVAVKGERSPCRPDSGRHLAEGRGIRPPATPVARSAAKSAPAFRAAET